MAMALVQLTLSHNEKDSELLPSHSETSSIQTGLAPQAMNGCASPAPQRLAPPRRIRRGGLHYVAGPRAHAYRHHPVIIATDCDRPIKQAAVARSARRVGPHRRH
jgi:hypothetical protein